MAQLIDALLSEHETPHGILEASEGREIVQELVAPIFLVCVVYPLCIMYGECWGKALPGVR